MSSVSSVKLFASSRTVLPSGVQPAVIAVSDGKIQEVLVGRPGEAEIRAHLQDEYGDAATAELRDFGELVLMPGVIDSHVHVNEPGRTDWEGYWTACRAAAAGGVTTIVDMPLNAIPPTTTLENLKVKARAAKSQSFVDIGFWGGLIPGNQNDLKALVEAGVVGFKCFLCPSGVDEFPHVGKADVEAALSELRNFNSVLAFHAELEDGEAAGATNGITDDPSDYSTYLKTRPASMEFSAISMIVDLCKKYNCRCHIVHLSAAEALSLIKTANDEKLPLTAETCYHYLRLTAEKVPRGATQFKCCPPIRDENNKKKLWSAIKDGTLSLVVSDHSPCVESLKTSNGDFLAAWGGVSSLQLGLSLLWTESRAVQQCDRLEFRDLTRLLCDGPARLCGLEARKGSIRPGLDADFVVWDPDAEFLVERAEIHHKNKLTPYLGEKLYGKVFATVVRGNFVYRNGEFSSKPLGQLLLRDDFLSDL